MISSIKKKKLVGRKFLVTAGPTYEKIDPVRFIGNFSSGKMGFEIANKLADQGAEVFLITGPTNLKSSHSNIHQLNIISAEEMYNESIKLFKKVDGAILSAAVSDYKPSSTSNKKIKRTNDDLSIELTANKDIAKELGKTKSNNQVLIGFALETNNEIENAKKKIKSKNLDFIVLNSLNDDGAGFGVDTNKITIIDKDNNITDFKLKQKSEVAIDIVNKIISLF
jgi:phosphopantothenoylcysteine decarboxylase / phosphopantothenate---cysteine ligase